MLCCDGNASHAWHLEKILFAADLHRVIWNPGEPQKGQVKHKQSLIVPDQTSVVQAQAASLFLMCIVSTAQKPASPFHSFLAFPFPFPAWSVLPCFLLWGMSESPHPLLPASVNPLQYRSGLEAPVPGLLPSDAAPSNARHGGLGGWGGVLPVPPPCFLRGCRHPAGRYMKQAAINRLSVWPAASSPFSRLLR